MMNVIVWSRAAHADDRCLCDYWYVRRQAHSREGPRGRRDAVGEGAEAPLFQKNTAAFIHDLPRDAISNVDGDSNYVRVQVLTPVGVLDREKQLGVVSELTAIVAKAAADPALAERTWVLIYESPEGGWGIRGHANTGADIAGLARAEIAALSKNPPAST